MLAAAILAGVLAVVALADHSHTRHRLRRAQVFAWYCEQMEAMIAAIDDILCHVERIGPVVRMLIVGAIAFGAAELLYGSRGPDSGVTQFILYGLVGFVPTTISSWLAHKAALSQEPAVTSE